MPRRLFNLLILASWLLAWSSAALHHHTHDCRHDLKPANADQHVAACSHSHHHSVPADTPDSRSWEAECRLCELLAIPFAVPPTLTVPHEQPLGSKSVRLTASEPATTALRPWQGRAPPLFS